MAKIVLACESGERESTESWLQVLRRLWERGLRLPRPTVADGHLGIWAALGEIHPAGAEQRCWNHKLTNVLDALPKKAQPQAAEVLKAMPSAETQAECERQISHWEQDHTLRNQNRDRDSHHRLMLEIKTVPGLFRRFSLFA